MSRGKERFTVSHATDGAVQAKTENLTLGVEEVISIDLDKSKSGEVLDRMRSAEMGQRKGESGESRY